jgi:transcriptional regulator with XRE-family HTH domain
MTLGSLLRRYRKEKKLTLKTVAEKSGVSEGFMSQVENNVKSPSLDTLMNICEAMDVNVGDLLNQFKNQERMVVITRRDWEDVDLPHTGFATRRFWPPENRTMIDSAILFLEPKKSIPVRKDIKNSQEVLCILKGAVELIHGERTVHLGEGDTVHLWSDPVRQSITNTNRGLAVVLWVAIL